MTWLYDVCLGVLWLILFFYIFFASIDFGTAFFALYARKAYKEAKILGYLNKFLSPLWEATNIFFIFFIIGLIALYPAIAYYYSIAFFVPGCLAIVLFVVRAISFVILAKENEKIVHISIPYALTGLAIPICLSTGLILSEGGFLKEEYGEVIFMWQKLLGTAYTWSVWIYVLVSILFISSMFLTMLSHRIGDTISFPRLRQFTLLWAAILSFANMFVFQSLKWHNPAHFQRLIDLEGLIVCSILCYMLAILLVFRKRYYVFAFIMTIGYLLFAFFAYGMSHLPAIFEPFVQYDDMNPNLQISIAASLIFICGLVLLIPSSMVYLKKSKKEDVWRI